MSAGGKNVRPVSPRGMGATGGAQSVIWMTGDYWNYEDYDTGIHAFMPMRVERAADRGRRAERQKRARGPRGDLRDRRGTRSGRVDRGLRVGLRRRRHHRQHRAEPTHTYSAGGRYFPTLTVTDNNGASSTFVDEILVGLPVAPDVHTGGAAGSTVHGAVDPQNQATSWRVDYGPTEEYGAVTSAQTLPGDGALHQVSTTLPGLEPGRLYHYRLSRPRTRPAPCRARTTCSWLAAPRGRTPTATPSWRPSASPTTGGWESCPETTSK